MRAARPGASRTTSCARSADLAGPVATAKDLWRAGRDTIARYLANDDKLAAIGNSGAFLVWGSQPTYPLYVWFIVGDAAWPSLLTWLSTPFFAAVPIVARRSAIGGRVLFVATGILNTLLSAKAFGPQASIAWFLLPCLVIAATFFRRDEWPIALALCLATGAATLVVGHLGAPLHVYTRDEYRSLSHLNLWCVAVLSLYLLVSAARARLRG